MNKLVKGTIENLVVDVTDKLEGIDDLTGLNGKYDVRLRSGDAWIIQNGAIVIDNDNKMRALCLVDTATTPLSWPVGTYELFLSFSNPPEAPRIGPLEFEVAFGMPEG